MIVGNCGSCKISIIPSIEKPLYIVMIFAFLVHSPTQSFVMTVREFELWSTCESSFLGICGLQRVVNPTTRKANIEMFLITSCT